MRYSQKYLDDIRKKIPSLAFSLFAKHGIEPVTMQDVADACNMGIATMYRYYGTKLSLVIQIAAEQWDAFAQEMEAKFRQTVPSTATARENLIFYMKSLIGLYEDHPQLLQFNDYFHIYTTNAQASMQDMLPYYQATRYFRDQFHEIYMKARKDHSIRTDIPETELYFGIMHAILCAATKFAQGVIYPLGEPLDPHQALEMQSHAFLDFLTSTEEIPITI